MDLISLKIYLSKIVVALWDLSVAFPANLIANFGFNSHALRIVTIFHKEVYDIFLCLVNSNKLQTTGKKPKNHQKTGNIRVLSELD